MQILGNIFNAIIYVSVIGSIFTVIMLFVNHVLYCTLPLWFPFCGMMLFCFPVLSPDVFLISPETQDWFNGFRIAREDFSLHCETDCDSNAMKMLQGKVTTAEYASAIVRLLELCTVQAVRPGHGVGALDFLLTKRRIIRITAKTSKIKDGMTAIMLAVLLVLIFALSVRFSREHFYPYPAYNTGIEYSVESENS